MITENDATDFITTMYRGFHSRDPDPAGLAYYVGELRDGRRSKEELIKDFINSDELAIRQGRVGAINPYSGDFRIFLGYEPQDLGIFDEFRPAGLQPTPGFVTDYIGSKARVSNLWDEAQNLSGVVMPIPVPGCYFAHTTEWLGTLKAVQSAKGSFAAMELGAGIGPWLAASGVTARNRGIKDIALLGVEGDPARYQTMVTNMADNGLDATLIQGAVGLRNEIAKWPKTEDPRHFSGGRVMSVGADGRPDKADLNFFDITNNGGMIDVAMISLGDLLGRRSTWDLIHMDVQGTEGDLCATFIGDMSQRVRWIVVGTHSRKLDGDVMDTMHRAGWVLEHEVPARMVSGQLNADLIKSTTHDGTQVWKNPRFG